MRNGTKDGNYIKSLNYYRPRSDGNSTQLFPQLDAVLLQFILHSDGGGGSAGQCHFNDGVSCSSYMNFKGQTERRTDS